MVVVLEVFRQNPVLWSSFSTMTWSMHSRWMCKAGAAAVPALIEALERQDGNLRQKDEVISCLDHFTLGCVFCR